MIERIEAREHLASTDEKLSEDKIRETMTAKAAERRIIRDERKRKIEQKFEEEHQMRQTILTSLSEVATYLSKSAERESALTSMMAKLVEAKCNPESKRPRTCED